MTVAIAASEIATGNGNVTAFSPPPAGGSSNLPSVRQAVENFQDF